MLSPSEYQNFLKACFLVHFFFKDSCHPKGYISEGEITIGTQSNEFATLQEITIREILQQFTMIRPNQDCVGT